MNKRNIVSLLLVIMLCVGMTAYADQPVVSTDGGGVIVMRADPYFMGTSIILYSDRYVEFDATLHVICSSIKITSCELQTNSSGSWEWASALTPPSTVCSGFSYGSSRTYSTIPSSGTYRIKVTFNADGHVYTSYSNQRTW